MSRYIHLVLRECLPDLLENVQADNGLLDWLYAKRLITIQEKQAIRSNSSSPFRQMADLIDILSTKDNQALDEMIIFLKRQGGQAYVVELLEAKRKEHNKTEDGGGGSSGGHAANAAEFELTPPVIHRITQIIAGEIELLNAWSTVKYEFLQRAVDIYSVDRKLRDGNVEEAIQQTLQVWVANSGIGKATLGSLAGKLRTHKLDRIADQLEKQQDALAKESAGK